MYPLGFAMGLAGAAVKLPLRVSVSSEQGARGLAVSGSCQVDGSESRNPKRLPGRSRACMSGETHQRMGDGSGNGTWKRLALVLGQVGNIFKVPNQKWSRARPSKVEAGLHCLVAVCPSMISLPLTLTSSDQKTQLKIPVFTGGSC